MKRGQTDPDPAVLGRILLLQSGVHAAPDAARLCEVIVAGLSGVPGVGGCFVCAQGHAAGTGGFRPSPESCRKGERAQAGQFADCPEACATRAERPGWKRHLLRTGRSGRGVLQLRIVSETDFSPYEPFVGNTANLIALHLENLGNAARLEDLNRNLERQVAERTASLIESEARFRVLSETVPQLVWSCRTDGFCDYVNARWLEFTGVPAAEQYGYGWWEQVHPEDRDGAREAWQRAVEQAEAFDIELRIRAADGTYRWFKARAAALRNEQGRIVKWFGTHTDIEDLRRAEEALRRSEALLRAVNENSPEAVFLKDRGNRFLLANPAMLRLLGKEEHAVIGKNSGECFLDAEQGRRADERDEQVMTGGHTITLEEWVRTPEGERSYLTTRTPWRDGQGCVIGLVGIGRDDTERIAGEEILQETSRRHQLALEAGELGTWDYRPETGEILWDERCRDMHGIREDARIGYSAYLETIHPEDRDVVDGAIRQALSGAAYQCDYRVPRPDGSTRWVASHGRVYFDSARDGSRPLRFVGVNMDISERKEAEEALRQSRMRLHLALDAANAGVWQWDLRTNGNTWSEELWKVFGLEPHSCEPSYESWLRSVHPEDRAATERTVQNAARTGSALNAEWRVVDSDGKVRRLLSRGQPLRDEKGTVVSLLGIAVDITDHRRVEEFLRAAQERYRLISENTGDVIWTLDPASGRFTYVSPSVERLRGYTAQEVMAQPFEQALTPESYRRVTEALADRLAAHARGEAPSRPRVGEVDQPCKDGSIVTTEVVTMLLTDEHGRPREVLGVSRDITARKAAERALRDSREDLARLNAELELRVKQRTVQLEEANQELEAFAYSVSHDLRAPLRAVDGFSHALKEDFGPLLPEEGRRFIGLIRQGAQQMGNLIEDLLGFSRLSRLPLSKHTIDTRSLVAEVLEELRPQTAGRQIDLRLEELPPCLGDPRLLKQVWINVLSNAVKYTRRREQAEIRVGCECRDGADVFFVQDNGCGFDMRYADRLFGVFQRLHRADEFEGTGVGLAIVQRIVRRHNGRVWAEAAVDRGATFRFTLEQNSAETDAAQEAAQTGRLSTFLGNH